MFDFNYSYRDFQVPLIPCDRLQQISSPTEGLEWDLRSPTMYSPFTSDNKFSIDSPVSEQTTKSYNPEWNPSSIFSNELDSLNLLAAEKQASLNLGKNENRSTFGQDDNSGCFKGDPDQKLLSVNDGQESFNEDHFKNMASNPLISKAVELEINEIEETCLNLNISPNPNEWTIFDSISWLEWASTLYNVPQNTLLHSWIRDGNQIMKLNEKNFLEAIPSGGDLIFAKLDIWKTLAESKKVTEEDKFEPSVTFHGYENSNHNLNSNNRDNQMLNLHSESSESRVQLLSSFNDQSLNNFSTFNNRQSNIQLWQFIKDLLNNPTQHKGAIHWIDKKRGIFRIVDSVQVAKMWGQYKNCPAMNYDKLSRSLRQYYKKGIMRKTSRTPRLIYQFCSPYHL